MRRMLEAVFRHPWQLLVLLLLPSALGVAMALTQPRMYQSTASLWALQRYVVIGATGPESDLTSTPASTQSAAVTELLQSRVFALAVARATGLPGQMPASVRADSARLDTALYTEISKHVVVAGTGYNLYTISYSNKDPQIARQVVQAVVKEYGMQSASFSVIEGQQLLQSDQQQLADARKAADTAVTAETAYLAKHPDAAASGGQGDPQYTYLHLQTQQAQATVQSLQGQIATLNRQMGQVSGGATSLFSVLDAAQVPATPVSRIKTLLVDAGGGLAVALLVCVFYVTLLVRCDRSAYVAADIETLCSTPVLLEMPRMPARLVAQALGPGPQAFPVVESQ